MGSTFWRAAAVISAVFGISAGAFAQTTDLATGGSIVTWNGASGEHAGTWLDQGSVGGGDSRRDLVIGAPSTTGVGKVYILFGGPPRTGGINLPTHADVTLSGATAGDGFGTATSNGNVLDAEGSMFDSLVVGAPNAFGGRGAVYVFSTGFSDTEQLTATDAVYTITGQIGDHLGAALATADIDHDGYREIILGAPGNNRVYVIYGSPGLSGARDLSTQSADITIAGTGLGSVIAAGDVTGDGIYDILLGAPSVSMVYLIDGRTSRTFSSTMTLSRDEDAYFVGPANGRVGAAIRVADFDADGIKDVLIGAPGTSSDPGKIYLLWGRQHWTSTAVADADVTFVGPWSGANLGGSMSYGNITRDLQDDLVMLVHGQAGGPDEVLIYYGGPRSGFGVVGSTGLRLVDLSQSSNVNRRIQADSAQGTLGGSLVFELTGEGARDIVLAAPNGSTASNPASGLVYAVTSPQLLLNPTSVRLYVAAGSASPAVAVAIQNDSDVGVSWAARARQSWLRASPASGTAVLTGNGTTSISTAPVAAGVYSGSIDISSTSRDLDMTKTIPVTLTAVSSPALSANVEFPAMAQTTVTWTAVASAGSAALQYQFWRNDPAVGWHMVQDYGSANTYSWTPAIADAGTHFLQVWVRAVGSSNRYDNWAGTNAFAIVRPTALLTSFAADALFPQPPGATIHWTAAATPASTVEFEYWIYQDGSGWSLLEPYGSSGQVAWSPTSPGQYEIQVWARLAGSASRYDDWRSTGLFRISTTDPVRIASLAAAPASPFYAGTTITWRAQATGGTAGPLQYEFWRFDQSSNGWTLVQPYSSASSYSWTPADPGDLGAHVIQVWVRDANSGARYDAWTTTGEFSVVRDPVTAVSLSSSVVFPVPANTPIIWNAAANGGLQPTQYKFWVYRNGGAWTALQDWSSAATVTWTPEAEGAYAIQVWARSAGSSAAYEAWATSGLFNVGSSGPATIVSLTADTSLPAAIGTPITWTAKASGGTAGPLQYEFWLLNEQTGIWSLVQNYTSSNTFTWTPTSGDAGDYAMQVWVRSAGSTAAYEGWFGPPPFTIK